MRLARDIWVRNPLTVRVGYAAVVVLSLWRRLAMTSQVPYGG